MASIIPYKIKKIPIWLEIFLGIVFAFLNLATAYFFQRVLKFPFFMDLIFVCTATFFGTICGLIAGIGFSVIDFLLVAKAVSNFPYAICTITAVLILRFFTNTKQPVQWATLLLASLISTVVISIEGGIIYTIFFAEENVLEFVPTVFLTYQLLLSNVPLVISAILSRIPINVVDKLIAVYLGFLIYVGIDKLAAKLRSSLLKK